MQAIPISEAIKRFRKTRRVTQEQFAEAINVTRQTVSNWETGKSIPDVEMILSICRHYKIDFSTFVSVDTKDEPESMDNQVTKKINEINLDVAILIISIVAMLLLLSLTRSAGMISLIFAMLLLIPITFASVRLEDFKRREKLRAYEEIRSYLKKKS
ncbi:hypothetical protein BVJ53_04685 [Lacticaseibacillus chiayiensis]|uniref:Helix-turn-helix domain-containing protein n=1 Tax=Lacticaseibacillus chiayiensis TaxID=2100821 RepID=A0A4Q1U6N7_9LACO|nr:helix-turn-helix transcriptional regulator [Lacticaseibacillus chiayiensis]QVI35029.1 helix-turn-helix transcriptional regulator [Lacticaseibacillus chiayiensis]RXT27043.1 hypothetical protein BVJ53_04685 [Lacticaseibacillus chiayiensis]UYN56810.1 helix-turn-helix domain-containing protein [Lacticaseibacillus chiayiensis]